jgi:hypothetical protein
LVRAYAGGFDDFFPLRDDLRRRCVLQQRIASGCYSTFRFSAFESLPQRAISLLM